MVEAGSKKKGFGTHFVNPFRSKQPTARAGSIDNAAITRSQQNDALGARRATAPQITNNIIVVEQNKHSLTKAARGPRAREDSFPVIDISQSWQRDKQTGEITDHTDMLHSLVDQGSSEDLRGQAHLLAPTSLALPGKRVVSKLTLTIWRLVFDLLAPSDVASLAFSCKAFRDLLGSERWVDLRHPDNLHHKINFLVRIDEELPGHLFCFMCATYHIRTQCRRESLKPANVQNPLFDCPNVGNPAKKVPRTRLTFGRTLPFPFVQLALRAHRYSADHGITIDSLSRRYKDRDSTWSHQTRYAIVNGHLLMRVVSQCFASPGLPPAGLRHLLYSREDFIPYFSVCAHWRDGELMPLVKCALSHIPKPPEGGGLDRAVQEVKHRLHRPNPIIVLCSECRPMRRCPECPTEYLIELKMAEDKSDPVNVFKQALQVTRWSDLGDGSSPWAPEWAACNGEAAFDSFGALGRRAVSGVFESQYNGDTIPGQRIVSLNPNKEKLGEAGHNWY